MGIQLGREKSLILSMSVSVLNTEQEHYSESAKKELAAVAIVDERILTQEELVNVVGEYEVILIGIDLKWDANVLGAAKKLKILATATTGVDHIDCAYASSHGITIISLKGERALLNSVTSTAELAFGLLLSVVRNIPRSFDHVKNAGWNRNLFKGHELFGKTIGIVGYGRLGRIMALQAQGFSMKVIATDPARSVEELQADGVQKVELPELLSRADVVSIHVPLEEKTVDLIGQKEFGLMKKTAYLINTSRGKIVNEGALLTALEQGSIAGAGLDVLAGEVDFAFQGMGVYPLVEYAKTHTNCIIVPHTGGMTYEAVYKTRDFLARKVVSLIPKL